MELIDGPPQVESSSRSKSLGGLRIGLAAPDWDLRGMPTLRSVEPCQDQSEPEWFQQ
jgi:hypothetical protein